MARVNMQSLENVSNFIKVGSGISVEIFKHSTSTTNSGSLTTTIPFADRRGFANGDSIYVGTSAARTIADSTLPLTGAGNVTVSVATTFSNNDAIVRKRDVSVSSSVDDYVAVYDSEDFDTSVAQPIGLDANNQARLSVPAGAYGIRYSDEDDNTVYLEYDSVLRWDSLRYANRFASDGHGTSADPWIGWEGVFAITNRVHFPKGYYSTAGATFSVTTATGRVWVSGEGLDGTFIRVSADAPALKFTATGATPSYFYNLKLSDFSIQPTVTNTGSLLRLENLDLGSSIHNIGLDPNSQTVATGIHCLNVNDLSAYDVQIAGTTSKYFSSGAVFATDSADIRGQIRFFGPTFKNCTVGADFTATLAAYNNVDFYSPKLIVTGSTFGTVAIRAVAAVDQINVYNPWIQKYTNGVLLTGCASPNFVGGLYSNITNAGNSDGAAIELIDCKNGSILGGSISTAYDGIVMSGTTEGMVIHDPLFASITGSNVVDTSTGVTGNRRMRGAQTFPTKVTTFTASDTTPTITASDIFKTANAAPTSITTFDDGIIGQKIMVLVKDANTTFVHGTLLMQGAVNYAASLNDVLWFAYDGTNWYEQTRNASSFVNITASGTITATTSLVATSALTVGGQLNISGAATVTGTIAAGSVAYTAGYMSIVGQGGVADDLDTITGGATGDILFFRPGGAYIITLTEAGNITCPTGAATKAIGVAGATSINCEALLVCDGGNWKFLAYSDNS